MNPDDPQGLLQMLLQSTSGARGFAADVLDPRRKRGLWGLLASMGEEIQRDPISALTPLGDFEVNQQGQQLSAEGHPVAGGLLQLLGAGSATAAAVPIIGGPVRAGAKGAARGIVDAVSDLPMDEASRLARAREMGFDVDSPVFHGTATDFSEFREGGVAWGSREPELAQGYAYLRGDITGEGGERLMPLVTRTENTLDADAMPKTVTANSFANEILTQARARGVDVDADRARGLLERIRKGALTEQSGPYYERHDFWLRPSWKFGEDGAAAIRELMEDVGGFDSVAMMEGGTETIGVLNPANVRSRFARFDPSQSGSADLLAGGAGLLGLLDANQSERR